MEKKGCKSCKKPKEIQGTKLDISFFEQMYYPTRQEMNLAYAELTSVLGVKDDKKEEISKVYKQIFSEDFDWGCKSCANRQVRKFGNFLKSLP